MSFKNFTDLEVYKESRLFRKKVSELAKSFPIEEKYLLRSQILDSSRSVSACIAEGFGRFHYQENIQFSRTARGSLFETLEHLITAYDEKYITEQMLKDLKEHFDICLKLLNGYIHYLETAKKSK